MGQRVGLSLLCWFESAREHLSFSAADSFVAQTMPYEIRDAEPVANPSRFRAFPEIFHSLDTAPVSLRVLRAEVRLCHPRLSLRTSVRRPREERSRVVGSARLRLNEE